MESWEGTRVLPKIRFSMLISRTCTVNMEPKKDLKAMTMRQNWHRRLHCENTGSGSFLPCFQRNPPHPKPFKMKPIGGFKETPKKFLFSRMTLKLFVSKNFRFPNARSRNGINRYLINLTPLRQGMQKSLAYRILENLFNFQPLTWYKVPEDLLKVDDDRVKNEENREEEKK